MAEIAVNLVIDKLGPLLVQEIKLLRGVRKEIEDIEAELKSIKWFLKDAEAKAAAEELQGKNSNEGVQLWVEQVREVAYCIEDVIDEFASAMAQLPRGRGLFGVLHKISHSIKKLKLRHNIANDIQDIKSKLVKIEERRKRYGFDSIEQESSFERRNILRPGGCGVGSYYIEEDQIVGYDSIRIKVNKQLVSKRPERRVIVLVGAGGLGKTTLAASAYKNKDVRSHFICHAWIYVGRTYIKEDLLKRMIQNFYNSSMEESAPRNIEAMDEIGLIDMLRKYLENKSYMVVFDDVWKDDFWADIEHALPDNNKSNRLIITARNSGVARFIPTSVVHISKLEGLPSDKAWQLFCKKAFNGSCPPELEELSKKIIEKCGGLPLAIAAIGGLLSHKNKIVTAWEKLLHKLGLELGSDPYLASCHRVLSEGYNDLPAHLKPCLLYFGLFPESYSIKRGRLIRMWIAEGFVQNQYYNCNSFEEVGQEYITELFQRNLVHISDMGIDGRGKTYRVHDLMHQIILKKTEQLSFCQIVSESCMNQRKKVRRFAIQKSIDNVLKRITDSKVRSIIFSNVVELPHSPMSTSFVGNLKLVQVLDFKDSSIADLHEGVGNLFHLSYLSLQNTKVKTLPKTIGKLVNLESLNLKETLVSELPVEIKHLKKLRYLGVTRSDRPNFSYGECTKIQEGFGSLMDLRNVGSLRINSKAVKELKQIRQLRKLGIQLVNGNDMKDLWSSISNMKDLVSLGIELINREDMVDIESMASPPIRLNRLYLLAKLTKLPDWIPQLQNLWKLWLAWSGLIEDPMTILNNLSNLLDLHLVDGYNGVQLHIKKGWFLKLRKLHLYDLKGLEFIMIEDGAMPLLERLLILRCPLLKEIPTGIENLRNLKMLLFGVMSKEFQSRITHEMLEKLQHIPKVFVILKDERGREIWMSVKDILNLQPKSIERIPEKEASS